MSYFVFLLGRLSRYLSGSCAVPGVLREERTRKRKKMCDSVHGGGKQVVHSSKEAGSKRKLLWTYHFGEEGRRESLRGQGNGEYEPRVYGHGWMPIWERGGSHSVRGYRRFLGNRKYTDF